MTDLSEHYAPPVISRVPAILIELSINGRAALVDRCYSRDDGRYAFVKWDGRLGIDLDVTLARSVISLTVDVKVPGSAMRASFDGTHPFPLSLALSPPGHPMDVRLVLRDPAPRPRRPADVRP